MVEKKKKKKKMTDAKEHTGALVTDLFIRGRSHVSG